MANLAFVVAGFVLWYLALRNPEAAETRDQGDVQARLGIAGLIADRFQPASGFASCGRSSGCLRRVQWQGGCSWGNATCERRRMEVLCVGCRVRRSIAEETSWEVWERRC